MRKQILILSLLCTLSVSGSVWAQTSFWTFDGQNREVSIPSQCDGQFDESRGGVFMPTPQELYEQGEFFLVEKDPNRLNAGYCFIAAALQGHVGAQFRLAQLYNKGIVLPQDDLSAYKWAFIASLNGHKEAERLALTLESFLSTQDIELATQSIESLLPEMTALKNQNLSQAIETLEQKQSELDKINQEIDSMLGLPPQKIPKRPSEHTENTSDVSSSENKSVSNVFTQADRYQGF